MRRWIAIGILAVTAMVSLLLLLAAVRCARSTTAHMPQPGLARCHRHQPISHLPLWRIVTIGLVPIGLLWLVWQMCCRAAISLRTAPALRRSSERNPRREAQPPPSYLALAMADGLRGGQLTFG
ncbi:MAG: hypothetical protein Q7S23_03855 [bacterium]|nr:hypothetical protein [bacterium]